MIEPSLQKSAAKRNEVNIMSFYSSTLTQNHLKPHSLLDDLLRPIRQWLDSIEVKDAKFAHLVCKLVPAQCPFERDVKIFGRTLFHIPPMCKLNPFYEQVVGLRFKALCYLVDVCGEDISAYC